MNQSELKIESHHLLVPYQNEQRRVRVLLPKSYYNSEKEFPVVYMHDGQNLFTSDASPERESWKVDSVLEETNDLPPMIIVAIDNSEENRTDEYSPWKITEAPISNEMEIGGLGDKYADFVVNEVKPFIDKTYKTKPEKKFTAMIGSSLGGTISTYMGIKYQNVIGRLGILASANWVIKKDFDRYMNQASLKPDQRIYIQVGTEDGDQEDEQLMYGDVKQAYIDFSVHYLKQLIRIGIPVENIQLNIFVGEEHVERDWTKHLPECLRFLSAEW